MSAISIRPFRRSDRVDVVKVVNAHVGAVVPGWAMSSNHVMRQFEHDDRQLVTEPWVVEREVLVAEHHDGVVGAALLRCYGAGSEVSDDYRNAGEIAWCVFWPQLYDVRTFSWDESTVGAPLVGAAAAWLKARGVGRIMAGGDLPLPVFFGIPSEWPHVRAAYQGAGFELGGAAEEIRYVDLAGIQPPGPAPIEGLELVRSIGRFGTRFSAVLDGEEIGLVELEPELTEGGLLNSLQGWNEFGELEVAPPYRRRGVASWLMRHVIAWARQAGVAHPFTSVWADDRDDAQRAVLDRLGFTRLTMIEKGWLLPS